MFKNKIHILITIISTTIIHHTTNSTNQLTIKKQKILTKIKTIQKTIQKTNIKKKTTISYLNHITQQIKQNQKLIQTLKQEANNTKQEITNHTTNIHLIQNNIHQLQNEYANMLYISAKTNNKIDKLMFIFSAKSFHNLTQRISYINQYTQIRKRHFREIKNKLNKINQQKKLLQQKNTKQQQILQELETKKTTLLKLQNQKQEIVKILTQKNKQLKQELIQNQTSLKKLNKLIQQTIQQQQTIKTNKTQNKQQFRHKKGNLQWPVQTGFITTKFGIQKHPILKNIKVDNIGIEIQTTKNATITNIHTGTVQAIVKIPGMQKAIIIKHGNYYTVYARITNIKVKEKTTIQQNTPIGNVATNTDGIAQLHMQIWHKNKRLNPQVWLK